MESFSLTRLGYYSQQVVHGLSIAQFYGPVLLMLTLTTLWCMALVAGVRFELTLAITVFGL